MLHHLMKGAFIAALDYAVVWICIPFVGKACAEILGLSALLLAIAKSAVIDWAVDFILNNLATILSYLFGYSVVAALIFGPIWISEHVFRNPLLQIMTCLILSSCSMLLILILTANARANDQNGGDPTRPDSG